MGPAPAGTPHEPPIEVLDALEGWARLVRRSPTLDGSIPLRAAQACTPLLEGNAVGRELVLGAGFELKRRLGGLALVRVENVDELSRRCRAALPILVARGLASAAFARRFADGPIRIKGSKVEIFTGLFVTAPRGIRVRISTSSNRRARSFLVVEQLIDERDRPTPIVLVLDVDADAKGPVLVQGEIATLVPLVATFEPRFERVEEAIDVARRHVAFYDRAYFESKQKKATRKYRRLAADPDGRAEDAEQRGVRTPRCGQGAEIRVIEGGPKQIDHASDRLVVRAGLDFAFRWDGHNLTVSVDDAELGAMATAIRQRWQPLFDTELAADAPFKGSLLYLTKYVTPHPRGEPHFFVKPPALVATPSGWSTLVEGMKTFGFDVMRGVVRTDVFHAIPVVFMAATPGVEHRVKKGAKLAELFASPRAILERDFITRRIDNG